MAFNSSSSRKDPDPRLLACFKGDCRREGDGLRGDFMAAAAMAAFVVVA